MLKQNKDLSYSIKIVEIWTAAELGRIGIEDDPFKGCPNGVSIPEW